MGSSAASNDVDWETTVRNVYISHAQAWVNQCKQECRHRWRRVAMFASSVASSERHCSPGLRGRTKKAATLSALATREALITSKP